MNFSYGLIPDAVNWIGLFLFLTLFAIALMRVPWRAFQQKRQLMHVFLGSAVALLILWQMKAGIKPGLEFHLLGGTLFTLMFGWALGFVGVTLVLLGSTLNGMGDFSSFGVNAMIMGAVPVLLTQAVLRFAVRHLPHHFGVYVMGNAFLCGGVAMLATVFVGTTLLACCTPYTFSQLAYDYLPYAPMMGIAEAFFTGMVATALVVYRPDWIMTFDDRRYLTGK